ncbi:CapA family protein [Aeromicrobium piscarium]|uniref:Capsule synthesis protein CapA domain-containing protein n=1 Tax=Aeromicrobium piscarium TaxID=2590901 RepID=A0A554SPJ1_9ACTN|nr:CapA family protein [Aeromicrobium piscarium]TSD68271.1 hypothetical protein FNM00_01365 [Aeromicrobium piscarium]
MRPRLLAAPVTILALAGVLTACLSREDDSPPEPTPSPSVDLAIAISLARPAVDLDEETARRLAAGEVMSWSQIGGDDQPLRLLHAEVDAVGGEQMATADAALDEVVADPSVVALVPADRVRPTVDLARVDGRDPLRHDDYPIVANGERNQRPSASVMVGGDVMLGRRVGEAISERGDLEAVWTGVGDSLAAADATFVNLESTLSTDGPPQQGTDSFGADPGVLDGLRSAGVDVIGLANNHIGDYGTEPMLTTFRLLRDAGFSVVGAGENLTSAREPAIVDAAGLRVGFYATDSIGETPAATEAAPGTNRIDAPPRTGPQIDGSALERATTDISALDGQVDLVVVVPHWGTQYTNVPEQSQHDMARAFTDAGADVVVGGHPHWVQGWEQHGEATVVHSLGNLVFDMDFMQETQAGVLVEIIATAEQVLDVRPLPYVIDDAFTPRLVDGERATAILELARQASAPPYDAGLR